jgi:hypothetical protein
MRYSTGVRGVWYLVWVPWAYGNLSGWVHMVLRNHGSTVVLIRFETPRSRFKKGLLLTRAQPAYPLRRSDVEVTKLSTNKQHFFFFLGGFL